MQGVTPWSSFSFLPLVMFKNVPAIFASTCLLQITFPCQFEDFDIFTQSLSAVQRRCEALPTMHCDLGATLYIIDFLALVAHCSAGLHSIHKSVN